MTHQNIKTQKETSLNVRNFEPRRCFGTFHIQYLVIMRHETSTKYTRIHSNLARVKQIMSILNIFKIFNSFYTVIVQNLAHFAVQSDDAKCHRDQKGSLATSSHPSKINNQAKKYIHFQYYTQWRGRQPDLV